MMPIQLLRRLAAFSLVVSLAASCANFRKLGKDLKFRDETVTISARITNADSFKNIKGLALNWDRGRNVVESADIDEVKGIGVFGFFVEKTNHQYIAAYSDRNGDGRYQQGEPAWIHSDSSGNPLPLDLSNGSPRGIKGALSSNTVIPQDLVVAVDHFLAGRTPEESKNNWNIPIALGEVAKLSEERFSAKTGADGYWQPAGYTMDAGIGIYFLEKYDPNRIPVLFVYGAAGSPQDWSTFFKTFDRERYQLWFYEYPSAERLATTGDALNRGIQFLQGYYGFSEMSVVAHSMGGLVSRYAVINNLKGGNRYIKHFVTISSPFQGMEFAKSGVEHATSVVPSWHDMVPDSDFQKDIFGTKLKGRIPSLLIYGDRSKRSMVLPKENDGTVSVSSVTRKEALADAIKVQSFPEDHVSILSNPEVIQMVEDFLDN